MPSPFLEPLDVTEEERSTLERWVRRPKSAQALALRCRIVLLAAAGKSNTVVAKELGICHGTARKWRSRFLTERLDGLHDEPRAPHGQRRRGGGGHRQDPRRDTP